MNAPLPAALLISQRSCCGNGCQNCPYQDARGRRHQIGTRALAPRWQRWVLFDFDGTIADSLHLQLEAFQVLAQRHGWPTVDVAEVRRKSIRQLAKESQIPLWKIPFYIREGRQILRNRWPEVNIFPDLETLFRTLTQEGIQLGILTSNTVEVVDQVLEQNKVRQYFAFVHAENNLWGKGRRLQRLLKQKGWNPQRVWYVGDEIRDLEAAQQAGIAGIGVEWGMNTKQALTPHATKTVASPQKLQDWLLQQTHLG